LAERVDAGIFPGNQGGPLMHVIAGMAVTFLLASQPAFADRMARTLEGARSIAAAFVEAEEEIGIHVVTGGTDVHLVLLDTSKRFDARVGLERLHEHGVNANAMRIAYDLAPGDGCSGLRLGATSCATRGFDAAAFAELGEILVSALSGDDRQPSAAILARARALAAAYPIYA
jgi:glycine hydroxymethyltransferase